MVIIVSLFNKNPVNIIVIEKTFDKLLINDLCS